jgi:hypothetical protein
MAAEKMTFTIRRAEPDDYKSVYQIWSGPQAVWGRERVQALRSSRP